MKGLALDVGNFINAFSNEFLDGSLEHPAGRVLAGALETAQFDADIFKSVLQLGL